MSLKGYVYSAPVFDNPGNFAVTPENPLMAKPGEAVDGADARLRPAQGVFITRGHAASVNQAALPGDYTAITVLGGDILGGAGVSALSLSLNNTDDRNGGIFVEKVGGNLGVVSYNAAGGGVGYDLYILGPASSFAAGDLIGYGSAGGVPFVVVNGVQTAKPAPDAVSGAGAGHAFRVATPNVSVGNKSADALQAHSRLACYNVGDITAAEYTELRAGRTPARLAPSASGAASSANFAIVSGTGSLSGASATGFTLTSGVAYVSNYATGAGPLLRAGQFVEVSCNIAYSGTPPLDNAKCAASFAATTLEYATSVGGPKHTWLIRSDKSVPAAQPCIIIYGAAGTVAMVSNYTERFIGAVVDVSAWTGSGVGIDRTGRFDLAPVDGVLALAPLLVAAVGIRCNAQAVSVSAGAEASVTLTGLGSDAVKRLANVPTGAGAEWTPDSDTPTGLVLKSVRVTASGTVQVRYFNPTGSNITSGSIDGTLTINKR